jgi:hypothetical protein
LALAAPKESKESVERVSNGSSAGVNGSSGGGGSADMHRRNSEPSSPFESPLPKNSRTGVELERYGIDSVVSSARQKQRGKLQQLAYEGRRVAQAAEAASCRNVQVATQEASLLIAGLAASLDDSEAGLTDNVVDSRVASSLASLQSALRSWTETVRECARETGEQEEFEDQDADSIDIISLVEIYLAHFKAAQDTLVKKRQLDKERAA